MVTDLASIQARRGHQVNVLCAKSVSAERRAQMDSAVVIQDVEARGVISSYGSLPKLLVSRHKLLLASDVVHVHLTWGSVVGAALEVLKACLRDDFPVIIETDHGAGSEMGLMKREALRMLRWRRAAVLPVLRSTQTTTVLGQKTDVEVVWNGVPQLQSRQPARIGSELRLGTLGLFRQERHPERYLDLLE